MTRMSNSTLKKDLRDENPSLYRDSPAVSSTSRGYAYIDPCQSVEKPPLTNLNAAGEACIINEKPLNETTSPFVIRQSRPREHCIGGGQEPQAVDLNTNHSTSSESANGRDPSK